MAELVFATVIDGIVAFVLFLIWQNERDIRRIPGNRHGFLIVIADGPVNGERTYLGSIQRFDVCA